MSRVTIRDVAEQAGVSVATVSKVINQRYGVSTATTGRVHDVIAELGYESSLVARSLRNHVTNVIGILVLDIEPFSAELLKGAARAIKGTGFELVVYSAGGMTSELVGWERRSLSRLSGTLIDGAVLVTPTVVGRGFGAPVVAVDPHTGGSGVPTIDSDNLRGAQTATEHLIGLGHRRIGFLAGRPDLESARLRELGYRQALREAGIPFDPDLLRVGAYEESASEQPARELLTMADRPTAVFAANDTSATTTMDVALTLGLVVPDDLSVIGFDNIPESVRTQPALTTIDQPIQLMGERAIELLVELMRAEVPASTHVTLPTSLVVRQSCGPPSSARERMGTS